MTHQILVRVLSRIRAARLLPGPPLPLVTVDSQSSALSALLLKLRLRRLEPEPPPETTDVVASLANPSAPSSPSPITDSSHSHARIIRNASRVSSLNLTWPA